MRLNPNFIKTELGEETLLVPVGAADEQFHGVVKLNETAAFLINRLSSETTEEALADALVAEYDVERAVAEKHVKAALDTLRKIHALEE